MEKVLSEVYSIVNALGEELKSKIPLGVWTIIEEKRNKDYLPIVDEDKALNEQGLSLDAITFIAMLHRDYWCESDEERNELMALLEANEEKLKKRLESATSTRELIGLLKKMK